MLIPKFYCELNFTTDPTNQVSSVRGHTLLHNNLMYSHFWPMRFIEGSGTYRAGKVSNVKNPSPYLGTKWIHVKRFMWKKVQEMVKERIAMQELFWSSDCFLFRLTVCFLYHCSATTFLLYTTLFNTTIKQSLFYFRLVSNYICFYEDTIIYGLIIC